MSNFMNCILVKEIGSCEYTQVPRPTLKPGEALIEIEVTGVCRTDLKVVQVGHRDLTLPRIPGEELAGRIVEISGAIPGFAVGDRVFAHPGQICGQCPACLGGYDNLCPEMRIMGFHRDGGFAQYVAVPGQSLIKLPEGLASDSAVFAEPLSCCLNALELAGVKVGEPVGIWGAGTAGSLLQRAALAAGAIPFVTDPDPRRQALAQPNPTPKDQTFAVCIVAVGSAQAYEEALARLRPQGRLVVFSGLSKAEDIRQISFNRLHYLQQTLVGAYGCCLRHGRQAVEMLAAGKVRVDDLISHRLPLLEINHALELVADRSGLKVLLYPSQG